VSHGYLCFDVMFCCLGAESYCFLIHHITISGNGSLMTFLKHWYSVPCSPLILELIIFC
jgi:hypothetical protein